jgi:hypothetical protein
VYLLGDIPFLCWLPKWPSCQVAPTVACGAEAWCVYKRRNSVVCTLAIRIEPCVCFRLDLIFHLTGGALPLHVWWVRGFKTKRHCVAARGGACFAMATRWSRNESGHICQTDGRLGSIRDSGVCKKLVKFHFFAVKVATASCCSDLALLLQKLTVLFMLT